MNNLTGLNNIGNTCYMNSALQIIFNCPVLSYIFIQNDFENEMLDNYKKTLQLYEDNHTSSFSPTLIKSTVAKYNKIFAGCSQEDSHEFIVELLTLLDDSLKNEFQKKKITVKSIPISDLIPILFDCEYTNIMKCNICNNISTIQNEKTRTLTLDIPKNDFIVSLNDCYNHYCQVEQLSVGNEWICPVCEKKVNAYKKIIITKFPKYLIIILKRYSCHNLRSSKISDEVDVPFVWNVENNTYMLRGVINHLNGVIHNPNGGHYVSYINNSNKWYQYNDSHVLEVADNSIKNIVNTSYILYYTKK